MILSLLMRASITVMISIHVIKKFLLFFTLIIMVATNLYDSLVDHAYATWQGDNKLSLDTLLVILPANQRVAICLSNLY